ncbi:MAG: BatD family protein [Muribaculaceae bacterium]|nr:BatD family protein [Muribaculaceae bacterium]
MIHKTKSILLDQLLLIVILIVLYCQDCLAYDNFDLANVKFEVICEDSVSANENIHLEYVLDYGDQFDPNSLELRIPEYISDCAIVKYLARSSSSKSISNKNGKMTTTNKIKWGASIKPLKEGQFTTPEVILLHKNDTIPISPVSKTVTIANKVKERKDKEEKSSLKNEVSNTMPDNVIIRLETVLDRDAINLGDSVLMKVKLQSNQSPFNNIRIAPIEIDDCFYESDGWNSAEPVPITIDGKDCFEWTVLEYMLTPLVTGTIRIPEIEIKGVYRAREDDPDLFFHLSPFRNVPFKTHSNKLKLKVRKQ